MEPKRRIDPEAVLKPSTGGYHPDGPGLYAALDGPDFSPNDPEAPVADDPEAFFERGVISTPLGSWAITLGVISLTTSIFLLPTLVLGVAFALVFWPLMIIGFLMAVACLGSTIGVIILGVVGLRSSRKQGCKISGVTPGFTLGLIGLAAFIADSVIFFDSI